MNNIDRATKIISDTLGVMTFSAENSAYRLAKAGLLAPEPQIIRTREELVDLDPDTLLAERRDAWGDTVLTADDWMNEWRDDADGNIVVIATGNQVRAARQALEEA